MDQHYIIYLLVGLLCLLPVVIYAYFVAQSKEQTRKRHKRNENQALRERLAAKRIAENDGQPLSARFASSNASRRESERSV